MVWERIKRMFRRHGDGIYLIEAADFEAGGENSAYNPSVVRKGDSINWLEADDNSWGVRVLDVRPVTHTMLLVTGNQRLASNAVSWRADDGTNFIGEEPAVTRIVETNLWFPIDRLLAEGVLFTPDEMEHKWALFYHHGEIICVDSWLRQVRAVARVEEHDSHVEITEVRGTFVAEDEDPELTVQVLDYLLRSHALDTEYPAPLLAGMERKPRAAAEWCMFMFGNRASFATPHQIVRQNPDTPLRTISLLHIAAARGDVPMIEAKIADGVPIDLLDGHGFAPLHLAMVRDDTAITTLLIERGSPVDLRSSDGGTPLMLAAQSASIDNVSFLLDHGADVNARDQRGVTSLHRAVEMGHLDVLRVLLDRGASPNPEALGQTPRSFAEARGEAEIVALLDEYNASAS